MNDIRYYVPILALLVALSGEAFGALPAAQDAASADLSADLDSLVIHSTVLSSNPVPLTHGEYRHPVEPGSASEVIVKLTDKRVFGQLEGTAQGAVVLATTTGGSGTFFELALLAKNLDGWVNSDTAFLGERIVVDSIAIKSGRIVTTMTVHGPEDPRCCPTLKVIRRFAVRDGRLVPEGKASSTAN